MLLITQDYAPRPFKRVLSKYYNSFSGYDQQDAHEFLLSMLSGLHEDTNRCDAVVPSSTKTKTKTKVNKNTTMNITKIKDKKNEEEEETTKTTKKDDIKKDDDNENKNEVQEEKDDTTNTTNTLTVAQMESNEMHRKKILKEKSDVDWKKHLSKQNSFITDLFHGQLCRSNVCDHCSYRIDKFEPFSCLSVNLRVDFCHTVHLLTSPLQQGTQQQHQTAHQVVVYGVLTAQVGLVGDLKIALSSLCHLKASTLILCTIQRKTSKKEKAKKKEGDIYNMCGGDEYEYVYYSDHTKLRDINETQMLYSFQTPQNIHDIRTMLNTTTKNNTNNNSGHSGHSGHTGSTVTTSTINIDTTIETATTTTSNNNPSNSSSSSSSSSKKKKKKR